MMSQIKALRLKKGLKQGEFAEAMGVQQSTVSNWETGRYEPDIETMRRIASFFGVSVDYLLGRSDSPGGAKELPQESVREVLAGEGVRILLDADANLTDDQLSEIVEFIKFKRRTENR